MTIAIPAFTTYSAPSRTDVDTPVRLRASMRNEEYALLGELLRQHRPKRSLEIGMANGQSTEVFCRVLGEVGGAEHVAIDPFQSDPRHWDSRGLRRVQRAGLAERLTLIEEPDHLALPRLVGDGASFDFILIDGWHSFDHTLLDLFYADILLTDGGVVAIHDTCLPAVYRACRFIETHKPYERLSPPIGRTLPSLAGRVIRRLKQAAGGRASLQAARLRRTKWYTLAAYRKLESHVVPNVFYVPF